MVENLEDSRPLPENILAIHPRAEAVGFSFVISVKYLESHLSGVRELQ
jgi:hypothetical protein